MKINSKNFAELIVKASDKKLDAKSIAPELWKTLYQNKMLSRLDQIFLLAEEQFAAKNNILRATVRSSRKLSDEQTKLISLELSRRYHKEIELIELLDENVGPGCVILAGDKLIDLSVTGKINELKKFLSNT